MSTDTLPTRLAEIVEDFRYCEGREKLEYLLEFADKLPALPAELADVKDETHQVHECMTPVFIYAENNDGLLQFHFDVPEESPTVRGYAGIMHESLQEVTPQQVLDIPDDFYMAMGLQAVLTGQRLNGLAAILRYMKSLAKQAP